GNGRTNEQGKVTTKDHSDRKPEKRSLSARIVTNESGVGEQNIKKFTLDVQLSGEWVTVVEYIMGGNNSSLTFKTIDGRSKVTCLQLPDAVAT
ncbi:hypothetical protein ABTJ92_19475, partial [Acinetobacter baumannii]